MRRGIQIKRLTPKTDHSREVLMMCRSKKLKRLTHRRGAVYVYVLITMTAMFALLGLAVDLTRAETAKSELHRVADAAARAAVANLPSGTSAAQTAAQNVAALNSVDGGGITINTSDILVGNWNSSTGIFTSGGTPNNAVQVTARRTTANGNPLGLFFSQVIGVRTVDVWATSTAALVAQGSSQTVYVSAHANPWLAGEPKGTLASVPDPGYNNGPGANNTHPWQYDIADPSTSSGSPADTSSTVYGDSSKVESTDYANNEPWASPTEYSVTVPAGSIIEVSVPVNSSNESNNQGYLNGGSTNTYANGDMGGSYMNFANDAASYYGAGTNPNGYAAPNGITVSPNDVGSGNSSSATNAQGEEHGISNIYTPINSIVGVFQNGSANDTYDASSNSYAVNSTVPPGLDFSAQSSRDYTSIEPDLNQSFYVGTGQTSTNVQQTIIVPANATQLYLGTMDGHEWSNNLGGFNVTITQYEIVTVQ
jgi:Flp pilus assembly protein TadG